MPSTIDDPAVKPILDAIQALIYVSHARFILQPNNRKTEITDKNKVLFFKTTIEKINQQELKGVMPMPIKGDEQNTPEINLYKANQLLDFQYLPQFQKIFKLLMTSDADKKTPPHYTETFDALETLKADIKQYIKEQIKHLIKNDNASERSALKEGLKTHIQTIARTYIAEINIVRIFNQAVNELTMQYETTDFTESDTTVKLFTPPEKTQHNNRYGKYITPQSFFIEPPLHSDLENELHEEFKGEHVGMYALRLKPSSVSDTELSPGVVYIEKEPGTGKIICTIKSPQENVFQQSLEISIEPDQALTPELLEKNDYALKGDILTEISRKLGPPQDKNIKEKELLQKILRHTDALFAITTTRSILQTDLNETEITLANKREYLNNISGTQDLTKNLFEALDVAGLLHPPGQTHQQYAMQAAFIFQHWDYEQDGDAPDPKLDQQFLNILNLTESTLKESASKFISELIKDKTETEILILRNMIEIHLNNLDLYSVDIFEIKAAVQALFNISQPEHIQATSQSVENASFDLSTITGSAISQRSSLEATPDITGGSNDILQPVTRDTSTIKNKLQAARQLDADLIKEANLTPKLEQSGLIAEQQPEQQVFSPQPPSAPQDPSKKALRKNTGAIFDNNELEKQQDALLIKQDESLPPKPSEQLPAKVIRRSPAVFFKDNAQAVPPTTQPAPQPPLAQKRNLPQRKGVFFKQPPNPATDGTLQDNPPIASPISPGKS